MNSELDNIKAFFTPRRLRCLSIKAIEQEANIPPKTLAHFLKGRRLLNAEHIDALIPVLVDFGYHPSNINLKLNIMKTLLFILIIISFIACNKQNDGIIDTQIVHYTAFCSHKGFDVVYSNEMGETKTITVNDTTFWDVTFVNSSNKALSIKATAHNVHSYLGVGIMYNGRKYSTGEVDNSRDTLKVCETSCQFLLN
jgi:hypothetical protein